MYTEIYFRQLSRAKWWQVFRRPRVTYVVRVSGESDKTVDQAGLMKAVGADTLNTDLLACLSRAHKLNAVGDFDAWVGYPSISVQRF